MKEESIQIGDLFTSDGSSLDFEVYKVSTHYAEDILDRLRRTRAYADLLKIVHPNALYAYYMEQLNYVLTPLVRADYLAAWSPQRKEKKCDRLEIQDALLFPLLSEIWPVSRTSLRLSRSSLQDVISQTKAWLRDLYDRGLLRSNGTRAGRMADRSRHAGPTIAIEGVYGVDHNRRSDLVCVENCGINPENILLYFYHHRSLTPEAGAKKNLRAIEKKGMRWVCLRLGAVESWTLPWSPGYFPRETVREFLRSYGLGTARNPYERYVFETGLKFLAKVDYWRSFFRAHNVKIQLLTSPSHGIGMAQRVGLELEGGVQVGKQRSLVPCEYDDTHGRRPQHVFFTWGDVRHAFSPRSYNYCDSVLIAGFAHDGNFSAQKVEAEQIRARLEEKGANFILALVDNAWGNFYITRSMIVTFYRTFLEWLLRTPDAGIVVKPKKPWHMKRFGELKRLLEQAQNTGRFLCLPEERSRLPSDAASCADLTIGIFVSSSVVESAIAGYRGVHCDLTRYRQHSFYTWGHRKVIFDDIQDLMIAIERYRKDPSSEPRLGDHSQVLDELDPFRDNQAGRRIGEYLRGLLTDLEEGCPRAEAIQRSNERYAAKWGHDKVHGTLSTGGRLLSADT